MSVLGEDIGRYARCEVVETAYGVSLAEEVFAEVRAYESCSASD